MVSVLKKYRERLEHTHGWNVALTCPRCHHKGLPRFDGWTPGTAIRFGDQATIFANLFCQNCGESLTDQAAAELVSLFSEQPTDARNRKLLRDMVGVLLLVPLLSAGLIWVGMLNGLWGPWAFSWLSLSACLLAPLSMWFNYRVHAVRHECECGRPDYVFMGLLGRSYCYRCSSCGKLLRLRD